MRRYACFLSALCLAAPAAADDSGQLYAPSVWDLELGAHATELPQNQFIDFACGTNGGPPSRPLTGWLGYAECRPEDRSGFREVHFRYDDEPEYWARARSLDVQTALYEGTTAYEMPVIVSGLFDDDGFLHGFRMISDPRADTAKREIGYALAGFLIARYGDGWACEDFPMRDGRTAYRGTYIDRLCTKLDAEAGTRLSVQVHYFRKAGQSAVDPVTRLPTEGYFESTTRFETVLTDGIEDREARLAAIVPAGPSEFDRLVERARNCPGCDLRDANLKRADLRNADLSGADLAGANLHAAVLDGANLAGANLAKANLNRAEIRQANLREANLQGAMMYGARLDAANLSRADLNGVLARKVQLIRADLTGARVQAADLREARLGDADFGGADLTGSWLHDSQLARANLADTILARTVMWRASLIEANLAGVDARVADLFGANMRGADLAGADFSNARLSQVNMSEVNMDGATFDGALMPVGYER